MGLWIVFAALTAFIMVLLTLSVVRRQSGVQSRDSYDQTLYIHQLQEIDQDLEAGRIGKEDAETAKLEISRRILNTSEFESEGSNKTESSAKKNKSTSKKSEQQVSGKSNVKLKPATSPSFFQLAPLLLIPLIAMGVYLVYGSPTQKDLPHHARVKSKPVNDSLGNLVAKVEARLQKDPRDGRGWEVIAPVYLNMGRYNDAAIAYGRAIGLLGETAARLEGYGTALVFGNRQILNEEAVKAFERAIQLDPNSPRSKFWLGVAKEQDGKKQEAIAIFKKLLETSPKDAPYRHAVEMRLANLTGAPSPEKNREKLSNGIPDEQRAMIEQMVSGLAERLNANGGQLSDWQKLIRSYVVLKDKKSALAALGKARENLKSNPEDIKRLNNWAKALSALDK